MVTLLLQENKGNFKGGGLFRTNAQSLGANITILATENANVTDIRTYNNKWCNIDSRIRWKARNNMSEIFTDTIRKTGGTLGTDIRIKNTSTMKQVVEQVLRITYQHQL